MPRIRSIKPECLQHRKVGRLSDRCVRVWLGMLTHADDEGRLPCDAGEVLGWCGFSYHRNVTEEHVEEAIQVIQNTRLIQTYSSNGTRYAWFPSWRDHQVISHPAPSKLPPPPELSTNPPEDSSISPESSILIGSDLIGREGKGSDLIGREGSVREESVREEKPPLDPPPSSAPEVAPGSGKHLTPAQTARRKEREEAEGIVEEEKRRRTPDQQAKIDALVKQAMGKP